MKTGVIILITDKVGIKAKKLPEKGTLFNNKIVKLPRRHNNCKCDAPNNETKKYVKQQMI